MPQGICSICSKKIRDSYTFIKQVRKCNTIFLKSTINIPDDNPLDKLEESFATENVLLDECDDKSIKEEVNPFDDEEMNAPKKEEVDSDSSSSFSNDNFEPMPPDGHDDDDTDTQEEFIKISDTTTKVNVVTAAPGPLPSSTVPDDDVAIKTEESEQKDEQAAEL